MRSPHRPPSVIQPRCDGRGVADWHVVVEALASGRTPLQVVGHSEATMMVRQLDGNVVPITAMNLVMRLTSGYKAALYALEVHDRVEHVLKSTAVADIRRWLWHPVIMPFHRCNNGEAIALRTRCRLGLNAAIGINWYGKLSPDDRKSCVLCGRHDNSVLHWQLAAGANGRVDDEVTSQAAKPQRVLCVSHVFGECAAVEAARLECWEALRRMAVTAGVHTKSHVDLTDRALWLDFMMGAPVPARFMAVGTHDWMRWYTNVSADKVGTAPKLHPVYFKLMTAAAPFLKLVVHRLHGAIAARRGAPPGVQFPPLPRPASVRRPLPQAPVPVIVVPYAAPLQGVHVHWHPDAAAVAAP
jgi:hypothetical protein